MFTAKTIKCKIFQPTKLKYSLLNNEYNALQEFVQLKDILWWNKNLGKNLHSANSQQASRFYKNIDVNKEYPISVRNDLIKIEKTDHKLAKFWVRIPVKARRGGVWFPIKPHCEIKEEYQISESKILKRGNDFYLYLSVKAEVEIKKSYSSILAIDIGEKVMATVLSENKPIFFGRDIRGIRRHYAWLRKRLGEKKLLKKIKQIGQKEQRIVNQKLHEISKVICRLAVNTDSCIILGDLKDIRKYAKGRRMNRIVSNMAYLKLTKYIEYKANWQGIKVIKIDERGTSHTCSRCGSEGKRPHQGLFVCQKCGYKVNADYNGCKNILKRGLETISSSDGAVVIQPITLRGEAE